MARLAFIATILMVATSCDKAKELGGLGGKAQAAEPPAAARLDLSKKPDILFQVFGEREDPRMIPVAAIEAGALKPIVLAADGWKQFDRMYTRSGVSYPVYQDGNPIGSVKVRQGMWEKEGEPLYTLPNCQLLTPLAAVTIDGVRKPSFTVEYLASSVKLGRSASGRNISADDASRIARAVGATVARGVGIPQGTLDGLDFRAFAIQTGATAEPTVIASFIDPKGESASASGGRTTHIFALADAGANGYVPTFKHTVNGSAADAEYRRYIDHLDVDGDGIDEIVVEGWQYGGDTFLAVLGYRGGQWEEVFRGRPNWCLDNR
jgi:hypothetical protein